MRLVLLLGAWRLAGIRVIERLCAGLLILMLAVVTIGVVDRYMLGMGLAWTEEIANALFIWMGFLAAVLAATRSGHYIMDVLYSRLWPDGVRRKGIDSLLNVASAVVYGIVVWYGFELIGRLSFQSTPALDIPIGYVYAALPVSLTLMILSSAVSVLEALLGIEPHPSLRPSAPAE